MPHSDGITSMLTLVVAFAALVAVTYSNVEPYMDEIFHIPQAQKYCQGNFKDWDSKITTFPGLYILSFSMYSGWKLLLRVLSAVAGEGVARFDHQCSPNLLRMTNVLVALASVSWFSAYRKKVEPASGDSAAVSLLLFVYPLSAFYYNLYYTDTASTASLVLTLLLAHQQSKKVPSFGDHVALFMASSASIIMRQTNAVWVLFAVGTTMLRHLQTTEQFERETYKSVPKTSTLSAVIAEINLIIAFIAEIIRNLPSLLAATWSLLLPVVLFLLFVIHNGGIVVGDKEHHKPVYHLAMPFHTITVTATVLAPTFLCDAAVMLLGFLGKEEKRKDENRPARSLLDVVFQLVILTIGLAAIVLVLWKGCLSHPFLLSDNRHYTFYIWSRFLSKDYFRIAISPLYYACLLWTIGSLQRARGTIWVLIYLTALFLTTVPAHLLEPRYFTPGVVVAILNMPPWETTNSHRGSEGATSSSSSSTSTSKNNSGSVSHNDGEQTTAGSDSHGDNKHGGDVAALKNGDRGSAWRHIKDSILYVRGHSIAVSITLCLLVGIITMYVFLYRPFTWHDGTVARFMF